MEPAEEVDPKSVLDLSPEIVSLLEAVPVGVVISDADGRFLLINGEARRIWGENAPMAGSIAEYGQYRGWRADTGESVKPEEWALARAVAKGETSVSQVIDIRRMDGHPGTIVNSATPIKDPSGHIIAAVAVFQDIADQRERQRLSEALTDIQSVVASTLATEDILERVLSMSARAIGADSAVLYALRGHDWVVQRTYGQLEELTGRAFTDAELWYSREVVRSKRLVTVPDAANDDRVNHALAQRYGVGALIDAAIFVKDALVGDLTLHYDQPRTAFSRAEQGFVREVSFAIGQALRTAAEFQGEQEIANALQRTLLEMPVSIPGLDFTYDYTSASDIAFVGGDFYDLVPLPDDRVCAVIGDVSGKGLAAARITMMVKNAVRAYVHEGHGPAEAMRHANDLVFALTASDIFVTAFLAVIDVRTGAVTYCSAGHTRSFLRREDGALEMLPTESPLVGGIDGLSYVESQVQLGRGDYLFMYTDGAIEVRREGELFGEARLAEVVRGSESGAEACRQVIQAVAEWAGGRLGDDLALLTVSLR